MRRAPIILIAVALAGCASGDDDTAVDTTESTPQTTTVEPVTTTSTTVEPVTTTSTTSTTTTTVDPTWDREAELAARQCLDAAKGTVLWIPFMYEFDDDTEIRATQDACDSAAAQLELEDGQAARDVALIIAEINLKLAFEMVNFTSGEPTWVDPPYDYSLAAFEAEDMIP